MINEEKARKDALYFMGELALQAKQEQFRLAGEAYMEELTALRNRYYVPKKLLVVVLKDTFFLNISCGNARLNNMSPWHVFVPMAIFEIAQVVALQPLRLLVVGMTRFVRLV